jgi:sterol 3beta-glucosyltransferase
MRITILTIGSRGDVQPYVALGKGLQAAGHQVCVATEAAYQTMVIEQGLEFAPLPGDSQHRHTQPEWFKYLDTLDSNFWLHTYYGVKQFILPLLPDMMRWAWKACQGCDAIVSMPLVPVSVHIAEKLGVPFYPVWTTASTPTSAFPHPHLRLHRNPGGFLNRLSYKLVGATYTHSMQSTLQQLRQEVLRLPAKAAPPPPRATVYAYSPALLPKPADWSSSVHVTGYWFLDPPTQWQPPQDLVDFLAHGAPPVYIGFGSMTDRHPAATTQLILEAIARTDQRAILSPGWAALGDADLPASVYRLKSDIPFGWLFPQMAAVVHHGGSGTVAEGLRAGVPQVVIYQPLSDQFFLGKRLAALGIGTPPIAHRRLTVDWLTQAIETVLQPAFQQRAAALSTQVRLESGVATAVDLFHQSQPIERTLTLQGGTT